VTPGDWDDEDLPSDAEREADSADDFPEEGAGSLASVGQRALARFIDVFVVFSVAGLLSGAVVGWDDDAGGVVDFLLVMTVFLLLAALYEAGLTARTGQTLGKFLMGIRVVDYEDADKPTPRSSLLRFVVPWVFLYIPPMLGPLVWIIVYLSAVPNPRRQGWHDRAAGTVVVRTR
jgi:uncharacterized RDD family membrane protein YckC